MAVRFTTSRRGTPINQIIKTSLKNEKLTQGKFILLGKKTHSAMTAVIDRNRKSLKVKSPFSAYSAHLSDSINFVFNKSIAGLFWGIGDKSILNKQVPYWGAVNWGSRHILPAISAKNVNYLKFTASDGSTQYRKSVRSRVQIIPPMNYIEKAERFLLKEIAIFTIGRR